MNNSSPTIPPSTQHWFELFDAVLANHPKPQRLGGLSLHTLPTQKMTQQNAHDFIEASFRFKDNKILNTYALSGWADLMKHSLGLHPSNMQLGLEVSKQLLSRPSLSHMPKNSRWNARAEEWIKYFINQKDHTVVKMLWDFDHYDGKGKELASAAVSSGDLKLLEIFMDRVDPRVNKFELLKDAIRTRNVSMFDRLMIPSSYKNKNEVLLYALSQRSWPSSFRSRWQTLSAEDKEQAEQIKRQDARNLEYMIEQLIPQADLNIVFFSDKISSQTQWMIPFLSPKSMKKLKEEQYYKQVKDLPEYQRRILKDSLSAEGATRSRKM